MIFNPLIMPGGLLLSEQEKNARRWQRNAGLSKSVLGRRLYILWYLTPNPRVLFPAQVAFTHSLPTAARPCPGTGSGAGRPSAGRTGEPCSPAHRCPPLLSSRLPGVALASTLKGLDTIPPRLPGLGRRGLACLPLPCLR